jgi:hypothetical protein
MRLTPEQAFFNSAPIDPKASHPYFLNLGSTPLAFQISTRWCASNRVIGASKHMLGARR